MSIYKNAIDSIALGVEDYNAADPRRLISATRNLVAGILLLIKHKLAEMSPPGSDEVLIKQRVLPESTAAGGITWKGDGNKTVDVPQMRERCTSLGITVDWKRLERIVAHRNEIEHYFPSLTQAALRSLVADSFILIRDFLRLILGLDPLTELGADTWNTLTSVADVYKKEKDDCEKSISTVNWEYSQVEDALNEWQCSECGSGLIAVKTPGADRYSATLHCRACGKEYDFESIAEGAISDHFSSANHHAIKDGGEPATVTCPNCSRDTYDLEEDCCLVCGESTERVCERCGERIPAEELDGSGYCSWCNHMMSKDD